MASNQKFKRPYTLGIEGGGTRTTAMLVDAGNREIQSATFGPGNVRLLDDERLAKLMCDIARKFASPDSIGIGLAGARNEKDRRRVKTAVARAWNTTPCHITHDLDIALGNPKVAAVLVLSGTGSCCYGKTTDGRTAKMGGWGHILGDKGSGFEIGLRALKAVVFYFDRDGTWSRLGERLLMATGGNEPDDLIEWVATADKDAVAALTPEVFLASKKRDQIARDILKGAASVLAKDAVNCAKKLYQKKEPIDFVLAGGVLRNQPAFAKTVGEAIKTQWSKASVRTQKRDGVWGAIEMARNLETQLKPEIVTLKRKSKEPDLSPTEQRNPRSMRLDKLPLTKGVDLMLTEEARAGKAVRAEAKKIAKLTGWVARALKDGGRLFYVGAGTSGRLGVLDASECPPTFRACPEQVQGIIAGGSRALTKAIEGAEDDSKAGARAVQFRGVNKKDVVIGIAASGRTPFVWGALESAENCGAKTALICFNPSVNRRNGAPSMILAPAIGPEVLTGSTRLKAGTATKLILNCITTLAMVELGKVTSNLMVDLDPKNKKLRERAIRIVTTLTDASPEQSKKVLEQVNWVVKDAFAKLGH